MVYLIIYNNNIKKNRQFSPKTFHLSKSYQQSLLGHVYMEAERDAMGNKDICMMELQL